MEKTLKNLNRILIPNEISLFCNNKWGNEDSSAICVMKVLLFNASCQLKQNSKQWITSYSKIKKHCRKSDSTIFRKLIYFKNLGLISKKVKTVTENGKFKTAIEITFTEKFYNAMTFNLPTKSVDKSVDKSVKNQLVIGQSSESLYIDNKTSLKNNISIGKYKLSKKLSDFYPLNNEICQIVRKSTRRFFKNTVLNEILRKLSLTRPNHSFRSLKDFITYFEKVVFYELNQEKEVNSRKVFFINTSNLVKQVSIQKDFSIKSLNLNLLQKHELTNNNNLSKTYNEDYKHHMRGFNPVSITMQTLLKRLGDTG